MIQEDHISSWKRHCTASGALLLEIIRKFHPIAWLRAKFGFPGAKKNGPSKEENVEMGEKEDEIIS